METSHYQPLLDLATTAAHEAGDILLADFLAPGGPRGAGEHADADDEAEALIRERLLAATPDWNYRGEETPFHREPRAGIPGWSIPTMPRPPTSRGIVAAPSPSHCCATAFRCSAWSMPTAHPTTTATSSPGRRDVAR